MSTGSSFQMNALFATSPVSKHVRNHLIEVYRLLGCAMIAGALGVYIHMVSGIGGMVTAFAAVACYIALMSSTSSPQTRFGLLLGFAALKGASIGPLVELGLAVDNSLVATAFVGTATVFACFSASAIYNSASRTYLMLGGLLSSAISLLCLLSLISLVFNIPSLFSIQLYGGLLVFCGFVLYDTQAIIWKAENGMGDALSNAAELYTDLVSIFVRVLVILIKNADKKKQKDRNTRR